MRTIRVFSHENIMLVYNMRNLLEHAGVICELRNDLSYSAAGEVPPIEVWPEIHIAPEQEKRAKAIIEEALNGPSSKVSWLCPQCSETNAPAFELCWQCGFDRDLEA